ncbi:fused MFS/spermidine synthase [Pyxidicoccus sp. MSG2]|uniref:fused MFS/spermidine synthase n=1 Tax=Pyxidicoccus sp. MSG2 TaxID=2996790 RepID=UPI002270AAE9|nr:fused MFS/spermidine synthase [Pyxidicoccus sp. MSG2]MCY1020704.1 fused MFS/spermidine synthase [Pyxidicoccus sp. MSG2]
MKLFVALAVAAFSGFVSLSYELLWFRVYGVANGALASSFPLLLGTYLLGLALGSLWSQVLCRDTGPTGTRPLRLVTAFFVFANGVAYLSIPGFAAACTFSEGSPAPWMGLLTVFLGALFPLVAHFGVPADTRAGARVSYLYVANIVGSAAGSLLTGFWLMDVLSTAGISAVLLGGSLVGAALLLAGCGLTRRQLAGALVAVAVGGGGLLAAGPVLFDRLYERVQFHAKTEPGFRFTHVVENRSGVITVAPDGTIYGGGTYDGVFNTDPRGTDKNLIFRAYALSALHPAPRRVLMIGLSSGSWAQVVANLPGVEEVTVVEINPGYRDLLAHYPQVASLAHNPKVRMEFDDGRRWLTTHPDARFDLIVSNTMVHWISGSAHVLSREFNELVKGHLAPGGVYFFNTTASHRAQRTATDVFPHSVAVAHFLAVSDAPIQVDLERWRAAMLRMRIDGVPVFETGREDDARALDALEARVSRSLEARPLMLRRTDGAVPVTDDNMGHEWD